MKGMHKKLFVAAALTSAMFAGASIVHAAPPNPVNGYTSVHDNILDKGANFGRCNALGVLAAKVCNLNGALVPVIGQTLLSDCGYVGVQLAEDPAVAGCIMVEVPCETLGTC